MCSKLGGGRCQQTKHLHRKVLFLRTEKIFRSSYFADRSSTCHNFHVVSNKVDCYNDSRVLLNNYGCLGWAVCAMETCFSNSLSHEILLSASNANLFSHTFAFGQVLLLVIFTPGSNNAKKLYYCFGILCWQVCWLSCDNIFFIGGDNEGSGGWRRWEDLIQDLPNPMHDQRCCIQTHHAILQHCHWNLAGMSWDNSDLPWQQKLCLRGRNWRWTPWIGGEPPGCGQSKLWHRLWVVVTQPKIWLQPTYWT